MLEAQNISHSFDSEPPILDDLFLSVATGEIVALLGPSGCGKSTLLRLVAGLIERQQGTYSLPPSEDVAFVFQEPSLMPWKTVAENVSLPLDITGESNAAAVLEALELLEIADLANRYPAQISGGQKMRVSLARALVSKPKLLLLDEPFSALDEILRFKMNELMLQLRDTLGLATLFVTHSIYEAVYLADKILVLKDGGVVGAVTPSLDRAVPAATQRSSVGYLLATAQVSAMLS
ncbi:MAG: ABC transporter ATP-binding protein, partial [Kordiimonadaceae bacterium]|nr:ABC transporter ATP-binding protein [Kordiimonadaceae bacterium]